MRENEAFSTLVRLMPSPVVFVMVPPVPLRSEVPSPVTVKLPVVLVSEMPLTGSGAAVVLPADTLVSDTVPPVLLRCTAVALVAVTLTSLTVTPETAPPLRPVALEVDMSRPRTVLSLASVTVSCTVVLGLVNANARPVDRPRWRVDAKDRVEAGEAGIAHEAHPLPDEPLTREEGQARGGMSRRRRRGRCCGSPHLPHPQRPAS